MLQQAQLPRIPSKLSIVICRNGTNVVLVTGVGVWEAVASIQCAAAEAQGTAQ